MSISLCLNGIFRIWGEPLASKHICIFPLLMVTWFMSWSQGGSFSQSHILIPTCVQHIWGWMSLNLTSTYVSELIFMMETGLYRAMRLVGELWLWEQTSQAPLLSVWCWDSPWTFEDLLLCDCRMRTDFMNLLMVKGLTVLYVKSLAFCPASGGIQYVLISIVIDSTIPEPSRRATGWRKGSSFHEGLHELLRSVLKSWSLCLKPRARGMWMMTRELHLSLGRRNLGEAGVWCICFNLCPGVFHLSRATNG